MEDYILREISKIGQLIDALLRKAGLRRKDDDAETIVHMTKTELADNLGLDIDTLLGEENFAGALVAKHGFSEEDLDKFAELLFDCVAATEDPGERQRLAAGIGAIYCYLDERKAPVSLNRYYILKDLKQYVE